ncbi:alpha/beta fold hydrolase [Acinetobacter cumulans]|uniref:Alpha/beta fold hydrolase n=1 Tax=Acinetobacter cumulans TaxID=2136182 RepID=A0ABX9U288_9GAMM|nr:MULTISPECIES: alpha/beta fold hydrolase [Acinetobacter]NWK75077.1 alpha/beta fold hydrolase [Acinetobacter sp. SwsAc6]QCO21009.1 alpha/beta fold hydrolase [Acinetobacter cumulans]RKG40673.1 alpha/beta fold hydrolase [Acinetobacter cumulans]RLL39033.1 alpha/beta fold hydrolase [Acinetobacter cumulans]RZG56899.1 alpha/beta fold hydrolase [Acinetobacter sp. WCHAc060006]
MEARTQWVNTSDQQRLYVKTWGNPEKPALVLVHGYPDNQEVWELVIQQLQQDFYIVTYDVRGAGQSSIPKRIRDYRLEQLSRDLESVVNAILPDRAFHLAAHDWGSIQSWESATEAKFRGRLLSYSTISGPCLDHAALLLREQFKENKVNLLKLLSKSWYIGVFQLPFVAPSAWHFFNPERWGKIVDELERKKQLPLNHNIQQDGKYGISLYRANFIPRLSQPRQRYAVCPVQAIVLKHDNFVSPDYIDALPQWVEDLSVIEVEANHWAILSQPEKIASYIKAFVNKHHTA